MMSQVKEKEKTPIPKSVDEIEQYMKENVGLGKSFDLGVRKLKILHRDVQFYYVNGLCDTSFIIQITEQLVEINDHEEDSSKLFDIVQNRLVHQSVTPIKSIDELVDEVLSGLIVVVVDGVDTGLVVDVRSYPGRTPIEPDTEKVIRGSMDAGWFGSHFSSCGFAFVMGVCAAKERYLIQHVLLEPFEPEIDDRRHKQRNQLREN